VDRGDQTSWMKGGGSPPRRFQFQQNTNLSGHDTNHLSRHFRCQPDLPAIDDELAAAAMMNCLRILLSLIDPGFDHFENEEVIFAHQPGIDDLAFEVGEAFGNEWRGNLLGGRGRQTELLELIHISAGTVTDADNLVRQLARWNGNDTFLG